MNGVSPGRDPAGSLTHMLILKLVLAPNCRSVGGPEPTVKAASEPSKEEVESRLYNQELSMLARRYLRDLRRDATIEMRDN